MLVFNYHLVEQRKLSRWLMNLQSSQCFELVTVTLALVSLKGLIFTFYISHFVPALPFHIL